MTHTDKKMDPIHIGSDLTDIGIWIQINPEIWIRMPHQILALAEFVLLIALVCIWNLTGKLCHLLAISKLCLLFTLLRDELAIPLEAAEIH